MLKPRNSWANWMMGALFSTAYFSNSLPLRAKWNDIFISTCPHSGFLGHLAPLYQLVKFLNSVLQDRTSGRATQSSTRITILKPSIPNPVPIKKTLWSFERPFFSPEMAPFPTSICLPQFSCFLQTWALNELAFEPVLPGPSVGGHHAGCHICIQASE